MSTLAFRPERAGPLFGDRAGALRGDATPRTDDRDACGGERIIDFALCLIAAAAVVGLLLLAL